MNYAGVVSLGEVCSCLKLWAGVLHLPSPHTHAVPTMGGWEQAVGSVLACSASPGVRGATAKAFICCQRDQLPKLSRDFSGCSVFFCCSTISKQHWLVLAFVLNFRMWTLAKDSSENAVAACSPSAQVIPH